MPEGDTIHRAACRLKSVLEGTSILSAEGRSSVGDLAALNGQQATSVEANGKHLMFHFDNRSVLHSHMGMTGAWHIYHPSATWRKPQRQAVVVLKTKLRTAVCFTPKLIQLVSSTQLSRNRYLQKLGPDLLKGPIDDRTFLSRIRTQNSLSIGEAVMNQTVVSGIGNVYKSEILFLERIHPLQRVREIKSSLLCQLKDRAQWLMLRNTDGKPRRTRFRNDQHRLWVYGRHQERCLKCGSPIQMLRQGDLARSTYFCPTCQPLLDFT